MLIKIYIHLPVSLEMSFNSEHSGNFWIIFTPVLQ